MKEIGEFMSDLREKIDETLIILINQASICIKVSSGQH